MNEILTFISAELGVIVLLAIVGLILKWIYIRSAIKSGVEGAIISDWYKQIIRNETKEAILDAMIETGLADEIKMENLIKNLK